MFKNRIIYFLILLFFSPAPVFCEEKEPPTLEWLKLSELAKKNWNTYFAEEDPAILYARPAWKKKPEKKILVIISKQSSSYSFASSVLLEVLFHEDISVKITFINFNKEEERGKAAISYAEDENFDLIFTMGSESATFIYKNYNGGKIPVVTCTNKDPVLLGYIKDYENGSGSNIAFTSLNVPLDIQMNYLTRLKPNLKNIGIMYDRTHNEVMATEVIPSKKEFAGLGIKISDIALQGNYNAKEELSIQIPLAVEEMKKNDPTLENSIFWMTSSTAVFSEMKTVTELTGNIPLIGSIPNIVTQGRHSAVLAIGIDRRNNAYLASLYAIKILRDKVKPGDLKVGIVSPPDVAVNFLVAKKIGLKIPFDFFESAAFIYDYQGKAVRSFGQNTSGK